MKTVNKINVRFIDLFAGVGGFHLAAKSVLRQGTCVLAVERDEACRAVYKQMFPDLSPSKFIGDVRSITMNGLKFATKRQIANRVPDHEILFAGFPCQPFSKGGQQDGLKDRTQGTLFHDILAIIDAKQPDLVVLENVANLVNHNLGKTWKIIVDSLRELGYFVDSEPLIVSPHQLSLAAGGTPQHRRRVYIIASRINATHASKVCSVDVIQQADRAKRGVRWQSPSKKLFKVKKRNSSNLTDTEIAWLSAWDEFVKIVPDQKLPGFPIWVDAWFRKMKRPSRRRGSAASARIVKHENRGAWPTWWVKFNEQNLRFYLRHKSLLDKWVAKHDVLKFPESRRKLEWQAGGFHSTRARRTIKDCIVQMRPSGIRVKSPTYFPALVAITQTPIICDGTTWRRITTQEAAQLQGFEKYEAWKKAQINGNSISDAQVFKQLGNAVHVGVAALVTRRAIQLAGFAAK